MTTLVRDSLHKYRKALSREFSIRSDGLLSRFKAADISIFHEFKPPPEGGGNQFLSALWREFESRGLRVENNTISHSTVASLCNSFNFDAGRLDRLKRDGCRIVHRVDGPIHMYRGSDTDDVDRRIWSINQDLADATVFQSDYSMRVHEELGLSFKSPVVIMNAADPQIFNRQNRIAFDRDRKIRLVSTSWSDNPLKGADIYRWLDDNLDWSKYDYTFVGRTRIDFRHIEIIPPVASAKLASILKEHDIYITASRHDPCSNALIEALSCGLPAVYLDSGGHPEIAKTGGLPFAGPEEIPSILDQVIDGYEDFQKSISLETMSDVADRYLNTLQGTGVSF